MHAYEILFSPTGGTAKVAAALTTDWSSVKTIDLSIPSTHYEDICLESDSLAVIAMPAFGGAAPQLALDRLSRIHGNGALCVIAAVYGNRAYEDTLVLLEDYAQTAGFRLLLLFQQLQSIPLFTSTLPEDQTVLTVRSSPHLAGRFFKRQFPAISLSRKFPVTAPRNILKPAWFQT